MGLIRSALFCTVALVVSTLPLPAQQKKAPAQQPQQNAPAAAGEDFCKKFLDQGKVDAAIKKGCEFLLGQIDNVTPAAQPANARMRKTAVPPGYNVAAELVLLSLIHGSAFNEKDERCKKLLDYVLNWTPNATYRAALKAMALTELDRGKYIEYIAQAGQYLIDAQAADGRWSYGSSSGIQTGNPPQLRASSSGRKVSGTMLKLKPRLKPGGNKGDNSNTQYAALGLRAAHDAGIEIPKETLELAKQWWEKSQFPEGGWDYGTVGGGLSKTTDKQTPKNVQSRNTMTAGGVSSLAIYLFLLGEAKKTEDFLKNPAIAEGIKWLSQDFDKTDKNAYWNNLYLSYSIERAGILSGFTRLADHDWYKHGAHQFLAGQKPDGGWSNGNEASGSTDGTCFVILFLKKATEPLIDTGDKGKFIDNTPPPQKPDEPAEEKKDEQKKE